MEETEDQKRHREAVQVQQDRYTKAAHAMQSGVAMMLKANNSSETPKHLHVGVKRAMVETATLARLLIGKGVFNTLEYFTMLADVMEEEQHSYEERLSKKLGSKVTLV